jgi:hypothetical protein
MRLDAMSKTDVDSYKSALGVLDEDDDAPAAVAVSAPAGRTVTDPAETEDSADQAMRLPLPDDLQVLALEFDLRQGWRRLVEKGDLSRMDLYIWGSGARVSGEILGNSHVPEPDETTVFGKADHYRWRLDIVVSHDILQRRFPRAADGTPSLDINLNWKPSDGDENLRVGHPRAKLFKSFAHVRSSLSGEQDWLEIKGRSPSDFHTKGTALATEFAEWARAVQVTDRDLDRLLSLADACDGDLSVIRATLERLHEEPERVSFLVPGLIPRGVVTLLLGDKKTGKSAVAMELAVAVARKESHWLGFPLAPCKGHAVYLLGEDSPGEAFRRVHTMTGGETPDLLYVIPADGTELDGLLEKLRKHKVDCLVVDPARKYHSGNEDDSTEISNMLNTLQAFAAAKNCAVVVLHHLKRGAVIKNINDLGTSYRGSGVYTDRARVTLGLRRNGNETELGIPEPGGTPLHNLLASEMFTGKRRLRRDEATFRHIPIGMTSTAATGSKAASSQLDVPAETAAAVERAAVELLQGGERVTKTGKAAMFERKIPALSSLTRAATRAAVESLIADGRLCCDAAGALSLPVSASGPTLEDMI